MELVIQILVWDESNPLKKGPTSVSGHQARPSKHRSRVRECTGNHVFLEYLGLGPESKKRKKSKGDVDNKE